MISARSGSNASARGGRVWSENGLLGMPSISSRAHAVYFGNPDRFSGVAPHHVVPDARHHVLAVRPLAQQPHHRNQIPASACAVILTGVR
jgi:hypothetical protein